MKISSATIWRTLLLASCLAGGTPAYAAEDRVTLNFVNAEIDSVVKAISQITGRNFLIDPRVKGTINVVSGKAIPQSQAYSLLLSALRMQGFAAVESGGVVKIVPEAEAKTMATDVRSDAARAPSGQIITKVFTLRHESAAQLVPVLRPLIAPNNSINANPGNNTLVVTDYAENVERLTKVIAVLDSPNAAEPKVIAVRHASAIDLAGMLGRLYGEAAAGDAQKRVQIVADSRINSVLVQTDSPSRMARVVSMIDSLDQPTVAGGNIHVVYLKNADAARLAQTLRSIVSGESGALQIPASTPFAPTTTQMPGTTTGATPPRPLTPTLPTGASPAGIAGGASGGFIQADIANNALIITAPDVVYNNLRRVIEMLDTRRAQVHIEALIVELNSNLASDWGFQWQSISGARGNDIAAVGGTSFGTGNANIINLIQTIASASSGATTPLSIPSGLNIGIIKGRSDGAPNIGILARFLETVGKGNVLSTPSLMTLDNEEARILVGANVPLVSGSYAQTGAAATVSPFQTFDRRDIGTQLKIRPQISQGGTVRLQIYQETSSVDESTRNDPKGVTTNKRTIESTVLVDDKDIIVLGGLVQDQYGTSEEKVPLLGDIPVLGALFRYQTRSRLKTNLMVFLQPRIVRDIADSREVTSSRYDYIMGEQLHWVQDPKLLRGEGPPPLLPPVAPPGAAQPGAQSPSIPTAQWPAELNAPPPAAATPPPQQ